MSVGQQARGPNRGRRPGSTPECRRPTIGNVSTHRGHDAGLRQNDLVARVHDDRLAVLLDGVTDLHHAKVVGDRILVEMLQPLTLSNREARLSPTIGIAVSATGYTHADDVLRDAETALHRAQVLGGSHCEIFDADVLKSEQADLQLENDFELALERREFALVYQPIVSIAADRVVGFEALVRWHHPVLGVIAPSDFIPIAERTGFIVPLGHWILHDACVQLSAWQTSLPFANDLWLSVNLSGVQVRHPALVDEIDEILRSAHLQPRSLVLELTEGIAMDNPTAVTTLLMRLRATGIRISIDDFGTGYSSLAYLHQFPVDALKIDRSFIRRMAIDKDTAAIVGSTIDMAQRLGLHVVAEGVENEDQLDLLRALQCESAQGYLFAEPLDADSAADLLQTGLPPRQEHPARDAMAASPGREGRRQRSQRRRLPAAGRWLLVGATVLGILTTAGVVALFKGRHPVQRSSTSPVENASQTPPDGTLARSGNEAGVAPSLLQPEASVPSDTRGTPVVAATSSTAVPRPAPARKAFDLVHLHRIGTCRGRLLVSREGVAFVPKDRRGGDAVALKHTDFVHSVNGDTLTIRSATKTYRFTAAAGSAKDDNDVQLSVVAETIVRCSLSVTSCARGQAQ